MLPRRTLWLSEADTLTIHEYAGRIDQNALAVRRFVSPQLSLSYWPIIIITASPIHILRPVPHLQYQVVLLRQIIKIKHWQLCKRILRLILLHHVHLNNYFYPENKDKLDKLTAVTTPVSLTSAGEHRPTGNPAAMRAGRHFLYYRPLPWCNSLIFPTYFLYSRFKTYITHQSFQ